MYKSVEKVVSEYVFAVGTFQFRIKGRISEKMGGTAAGYTWTVSHHYKLKDAPGPVYPQKTDCASREEAERLLFTYVRNVTDIVEPNAFY
jgi:hypothetical protein